MPESQRAIPGKAALTRQAFALLEKRRGSHTLLRITADDKPRVLSFRLEGRLEGPWVDELETCWRGMLARAGALALRVDLTGVTFVDPAGKAQLVAMHRQGAELVASDCLTKAIVSEIVGDGAGNSISRDGDGE